MKMDTDIIVIILTFVLTVLLAIPLGKYISGVFKGEKTLLDFLTPFEKWIFRISGINAEEEMNWKQNLKAMITINMIWFVWAILVLMLQDHLFLNPDKIPGMSLSQAFNTAVSFMTNTNLQHYSGETGASYLSQLFVMCFLQFVSAGTGIAAAAILFKGLAGKSGSDIGNFYVLLIRSCTRILLPLAIIFGLFLLFHGTPSTLEGAQEVITL